QAAQHRPDRRRVRAPGGAHRHRPRGAAARRGPLARAAVPGLTCPCRAGRARVAYARAVTDNTVTGAGTAFPGRRADLAALRFDCDRGGLDTLAGRPVPRARVLLVAGRPGSGRTTLAEEFAGEVLASGAYPDGLLRARL